MKRLRLIFMGTPQIARHCLEALLPDHDVTLVISRPDEPAGRGKVLRSPPVALLAKEQNIPLLQPEKIRNAEFYARLRSEQPDAIVVVAYGKILPRDILEIPPLGCLNIHASLLPALRGAAPIQWSIVRGLQETGVTLMKMDEGMDTGPMIDTRRVAITEEDTGETLTAKLAVLGAELLREALPAYAAGALAAAPQPSEGVSIAPILQKEAGNIDWSRPAQEIAWQVRGLRPWPMAYTSLPSGQTLRILMAKPTQGVGRPGEILVADPKKKAEAFVVATGSGALVLQEVQQEGRTPQPANIFVGGARLAVGSLLGALPPQGEAS